MGTIATARVVEGTAEVTFPYTINGCHAADFEVAVDYTVRFGNPGEGVEITSMGRPLVVCLAQEARFERDEGGNLIRLPNGRLAVRPARYVAQEPSEDLQERIEAWLATREGQAAIIEAAESLVSNIG